MTRGGSVLTGAVYVLVALVVLVLGGITAFGGNETQLGVSSGEASVDTISTPTAATPVSESTSYQSVAKGNEVDPLDESGGGDPDPAMLRDPDSSSPKAQSGETFDQKTLDAMARSYRLSHQAEATKSRDMPSDLPFTPKGSSKIAGYWGRVSNGIIDNGNRGARDDYQYYEFSSDGTYLLRGHSLIMGVIDSKGFYRVDGDKLSLVHTKLLYKGKWVDSDGYVPFTCSLMPQGDHLAFRADISDVTFYKDVRWNFEKGAYHTISGTTLRWDPQQGLIPLGSRRSNSKDPVYGLFPCDEGEFAIKAVMNAAGKIERLIIVPVHHFYGPDDGKEFLEERRIQVERAEKWLVKNGVPKSIPRQVVEE